MPRLALATLRAYQAGWQAFSEWCQLAGWTALPAAPEMVADHLVSLATASAAPRRYRPVLPSGRPAPPRPAAARPGVLRRAELVAVEREHVIVTPEGFRLQIPRNKADTTGQSAELGIPRSCEQAS